MGKPPIFGNTHIQICPDFERFLGSLLKKNGSPSCPLFETADRFSDSGKSESNRSGDVGDLGDGLGYFVLLRLLAARNFLPPEISHMTRWWFQIFLFPTLFGEDSHID